MYGFHKARHDSSKCVFSHPLFRRDQPYFQQYLVNFFQRSKGKWRTKMRLQMKKSRISFNKSLRLQIRSGAAKSQQQQKNSQKPEDNYDQQDNLALDNKTAEEPFNNYSAANNDWTREYTSICLSVECQVDNAKVCLTKANKSALTTKFNILTARNPSAFLLQPVSSPLFASELIESILC